MAPPIGVELRVVVAVRWEPGKLSNLSELKDLAEAAGYEVVGSLEQVRREDPSYNIGAGKAEELAKEVKELKAEGVIFGNLLKPVQEYRLATMTKVEAIDRMRLILEIFSRRASLKEAKLQIQLAKLNYEVTRARERVRLAKQGEQPGFHGLGRYNVDVYYLMLKHQASRVEDELKRIREGRARRRSKRGEGFFSTVSLAGYTSAGKSTLFKLLTSKSVSIGEGLFTTLSPTSHITEFEGKRALLIDTVGFIDELPLILLEAFKSTLEETIFADLILLMVDMGDPLDEIIRKLRCSLSTLTEIGASNIPIITVLNKVDLISEAELNDKLTYLKTLAPNPVPISAMKSINIDRLSKVAASLLKKYVKAKIVMPLDGTTMQMLSSIHSNASIVKENFTGRDVELEVEAIPAFLNKIRARVEGAGGSVKLIAV